MTPARAGEGAIAPPPGPGHQRVHREGGAGDGASLGASEERVEVLRLIGRTISTRSTKGGRRGAARSQRQAGTGVSASPPVLANARHSSA